MGAYMHCGVTHVLSVHSPQDQEKGATMIRSANHIIIVRGDNVFEHKHACHFAFNNILARFCYNCLHHMRVRFPDSYVHHVDRPGLAGQRTLSILVMYVGSIPGHLIRWNYSVRLLEEELPCLSLRSPI